MKKLLLKILTITFALTLCLGVITACGENETPSHTHDYKTLKYDNENHWYECECSEKATPVAHTISNNACLCGYVVEEHSHDYKTLKYDNENHWHECDCGEKSNLITHTIVNNICLCGYVKIEEHTHDYKTLKYDSIGHWYECLCGDYVSKTLHNLIDNRCLCGYEYKEEYTITIVYGNGEVNKKITQEYNSLITEVLPTDIERDGYIFKGWDFELPEKMPKGDLTITAIWEDIFVVSAKGEITSLTMYAKSMSLKNIVIPDKIENIEIVSINRSVFADYKSLENIVISRNIKNIYEGAFYNCSSLKEITFANNSQLENIYAYAFYNCHRIQKVNFCGSIDNWVEIYFADIYSNPMMVGYFTDFYINNVQPINVELKSATKINDYAFYDCDTLENVEISDNVTYIGENVFNGCSSLKFNEKDGFKYLGNKNNMYLYLYGVKSTSIKTASVDENCKFINEGAFSNCNMLESIELPFIGASLTADKIYDEVFGYIFGYVYSNSAVSGAINQCWVDTKAVYYYIPSSIKTVIIRGGIVPASAFNNCMFLEDIELRENVKYIKYGAFENCTSLESIIIPNSVTSIGEGAFSGCTSLINIEISDSVTSIGDKAFEDCTSLKFNIKDGLKYLGNNENKYLYLAGIVDEFITTANIDSNCRFIGDTFWGGYLLENIIIPNSVISISDSAFSACMSLKYNIKDDIKYLGNNENKYLYLAYAEDESIATANIDSNCKFIGGYAFEDCSSLISVEIPDSVISIGDRAFEDCTSLISVEIPDSVISIGYNAFYNSRALTIYCEAESKPSGWHNYWSSLIYSVVWGYAGN